MARIPTKCSILHQNITTHNCGISYVRDNVAAIQALFDEAPTASVLVTSKGEPLFVLLGTYSFTMMQQAALNQGIQHTAQQMVQDLMPDPDPMPSLTKLLADGAPDDAPDPMWMEAQLNTICEAFLEAHRHGMVLPTKLKQVLMQACQEFYQDPGMFAYITGDNGEKIPI